MKLGQGYVFTRVCDSVHRGGGAWSGGGLLLEGCGEPPPVTATAAGGTHPTGMHSCLTSCVNSTIGIHSTHF